MFAARSLHRQALRAVLHHQARGRRRAGLRRHQADEVRGELSHPSHTSACRRSVAGVPTAHSSGACWPRPAALSSVRRKKCRARSGKKSQHGIMSKRSGAVSIAYTVSIGLLALTIASLHYSWAHAQSADLVLCDRLAAEPADPDKPADVKGTAVIAQSDVATAIKFCKIASASSRRALYQLGRAYAANRQMAEADGDYRKAADKGSTSAMVDLGVLFGTGSGVPKDQAAARKLFERAAEAGNPRGVSNLAALGGGAVSDPVKARALLAKAAETNSAEAQYQLPPNLSPPLPPARLWP